MKAINVKALKEKAYITRRVFISKLQSIPFYVFRMIPIKKNKIVFCCIEGTTGYTCNPKYIAKELIRKRQTLRKSGNYELIWLVNDATKKFPKGIKKVRNTLLNRAYHLTTAHIWIDNSRKQLEVRKRKGQIYIQTWHAKLGFKPTCLDRGKSFSKIAYLVSKHDSDMVDYWLSNSEWYDKTLPTGSLYEGKKLRIGSPRCDILVKAWKNIELKNRFKEKLAQKFSIEVQKSGSDEIHFMMYAPTFRGGSQETDRKIKGEEYQPDNERLVKALEKRFGGTWYILLRQHPQLVARNLDNGKTKGRVIDVSRIDDMYVLLAGCDAFMTDYSSAAFDAAVMRIPVFLYVNDYEEYEKERGKLLWNLKELPFLLAENDKELEWQVLRFDEEKYIKGLEQLFVDTKMTEDGNAASYLAKIIEEMIQNE